MSFSDGRVEDVLDPTTIAVSRTKQIMSNFLSSFGEKAAPDERRKNRELFSFPSPHAHTASRLSESVWQCIRECNDSKDSDLSSIKWRMEKGKREMTRCCQCNEVQADVRRRSPPNHGKQTNQNVKRWRKSFSLPKYDGSSTRLQRFAFLLYGEMVH